MSVLKAISLALDCLMPPYEGVRELESMRPLELVASIDADGESSKERPLPVEGLVAAFPYRARLAKAAIVEIKTNMNRRVVRVLAEASYMKTRASVAGFASAAALPPILAPMPMTERRRRERGWNQCELVAEEWARIDGERGGQTFAYVRDALRRTRETGDQVGMGRGERAANMRDSFAAGEDARGRPVVRGRDVIILDDVATTGATLREARRAALAGGARRVLLVSIGY